MRQVCACGSPHVIRHGVESGRRAFRLAAGRVERVACQSTRFLCRSCGRTFGVRDGVALAGERAARDHVAERAFTLGRAGAAREAGIDESGVNRLMRDWREVREGDLPGTVPDFLILEVVPVRGREPVMLVDVDRETVVEVFRGRDGVADWLARPGHLSALRACIPLDAELSKAVRGAMPETEVMVAPSVVARAVRSALAAGLATLRRLPSMVRRNGFPGTARFLRVLDGRIPAGEGWPLECTALMAAGRLAADIAASPARSKAEGLWPEFEVASSAKGAGPLVRLMSTWKAEILSGLDHRFVDGIAQVSARVRRLASTRRPALAFQDFRGLVLLRDVDRGLRDLCASLEASPGAVPG